MNFNECREILLALKELPYDWDGQGAIPLTDRCYTRTSALLASVETLPRPWLELLPEGHIRLEWDWGPGVVTVEITDTVYKYVDTLNKYQPTEDQLFVSLDDIVSQIMFVGLLIYPHVESLS